MEHRNLRCYNTDGAVKFIKQTTGGAGPAKKTLDKLAVTGGGPPFRKFSQERIYEEDDLVAWIQTRLSAKVATTSELPGGPNPQGRKGRPRKLKTAASETARPPMAFAENPRGDGTLRTPKVEEAM
jgi:hypothetical protein